MSKSRKIHFDVNAPKAIEAVLHILIPKRAPNMDFLSESDVEALDAGINKYLGLPFGEVRSLNHQEKCWLEAEMNLPIDFELMIDNPEVKKMLEDIPLKIVV